MDASRTARHTWIATLLLVATIFVLYSPTLEHDFVWDDQLYVVRNEAVQDWSRAGEAFTSPRTTWTANAQYMQIEWRPVRNISYLVDHSLFQLNPMGWHLHNIALHAIAAVLLFFLIRRLWRLFVAPKDYVGIPPVSVTIGSFIGALVWAVHPVQTEVVAWVKSRDDLLATPLVFGALLLALPKSRAATHPGILALICALVLYVAAILSKENAVVLGALLPLLLVGRALCWFGMDTVEYCGKTDGEYLNMSEERRIERRQRLRAAVYISLVFIGVTIAMLAVRDVMLGRTSQADYPGTFSQMILTMTAAFTRYVQLIVWPWPPTLLKADYDGFPIISSWMTPVSMAGMAILLMIIIIADSTRYKAPIVSLGFMFFLVALIPYSNVIPMMQIMAERFLYLPLAGIAMIVAWAVMAVQPMTIRQLAPWVTAIAVVALAGQTWMRLPVWKSELVLFESAREANPNSWRPANLYVKALLRDEQTTAAVVVARENLQKWPRDPDIVRTAAVAHLLAGDEATGAELTDIAVRLQPNDPRALQTYQMWRAMKRKSQQDIAVTP